MKNLTCFIIMILCCNLLHAQVAVTNTSVLNISNTTDTLYINGSFTNTSTAAFTNTGNFFVKGDITNNQSTDLTGTGIFFINGGSNQNISATYGFKNITLNKTGGVAILSTNVKVTGVLNFISGKIQTGTNTMILPSGATLTGAAQNAGWVNGKLQKYFALGAQSKLFEVGDAAVYTPVSLVFPNILTAGSITTNTTAGDHPNLNTSIIIPNKSVNRNYTLTNTGAVFNSYSVTFNFINTDVDVTANTAAFQVGLYNGSWAMPSTSNRNATSTRMSGFSQLGSFAIGETFIVVPVKFITAVAEKQGAVNKITWRVTNEINISKYLIERSNSATGPFTEMASTLINNTGNYSGLDMQPLSSANYYRIRAAGNDGQSFYSNVIHVNSLNSGSSVSVFPNPVKGSVVSLQLVNIPKDNYTVRVFNAMGQMIKTSVLYHSGANGNQPLFLLSLPPGRYEISLKGVSGNFRTTLIKE